MARRSDEHSLIPVVKARADLEVGFLVVQHLGGESESHLHSIPAMEIGPATIQNQALLSGLELAKRALILGTPSNADGSFHGYPLVELHRDQSIDPMSDDGDVIVHGADGLNDDPYIVKYV